MPFTHRRNAIFGIDRARIRNTIEETNTRVRYTNSEIRFPNRLEIRVRERYPVFQLHFADGEKTAVMCGFLRVLDIFDVDVFEEFQETKLSWPLIAIPDEIASGLTLGDLQVGAFLTDIEYKGPYVGILQELAPFFARLSTYEDALCNIFESISFEGVPGNIRLVMRARRATTNTYHNNYFDFIVWNAEYRLRDKLTRGWQALENNHTAPGVYQMWEQETFVVDGVTLAVTDGILVTFRSFLPGEGRQ